MLLAVKAVVSAVIIVGINAIAQRNPFFGGWIAALPLITLLSIAWLSFDQRGDAQIARFLTGVLWGLVPTAFLLVVTAALLTRGVPLAVAVVIGIVTWMACLLAAREFGLLRI